MAAPSPCLVLFWHEHPNCKLFCLSRRKMYMQRVLMPRKVLHGATVSIIKYPKSATYYLEQVMVANFMARSSPHKNGVSLESVIISGSIVALTWKSRLPVGWMLWSTNGTNVEVSKCSLDNSSKLIQRGWIHIHLESTGFYYRLVQHVLQSLPEAIEVAKPFEN